MKLKSWGNNKLANCSFELLPSMREHGPESHCFLRLSPQCGIWLTWAVIVEMTANFEIHENKINVHRGKLLSLLKLFVIFKKINTSCFSSCPLCLCLNYKKNSICIFKWTVIQTLEPFSDCSEGLARVTI